MNKQFSQKIYIGFALTILGIGMFLASPVFAIEPGGNLIVQFEKTPLFDEVNFLPGESVIRWAEVVNNSGETKKIGLEIINNSSCSANCLSDELDLVVSENGTTLYSGSLTTFYEAGEKVLSNLNTGATTKYYFSMTFNPDAGNVYKNSATNFDIKIGFFGEESIGQEITPGGGGGGGSVIVSGLIISNEAVSSIETDTVTITWLTNLNSTSRVIYSPGGFPHLLQLSNPPNYGYVFSTPEDSNKVTFHTVTIDGLLSGTTYYYRCVSHGSLAISTEYSFTTLGAQEIEKIGEEEEGGAGEVPVVEISLDELSGKSREEGEPAYGPEGAPAGEEGLVEKPSLTEVAVEEGPIVNLAGLLAAIGKLPLNLKVILVIVFLILIALIILWLFKKKKDNKIR